MLLIASAVFYCFFIPKYLFILLFVIAIDYSAGLLIEKYNSYKKVWLVSSICSNLGVLFFFKYYNFFAQNINGVFGSNWVLTHFILPIGLSFHTFQSLSYIIEVYRGNFKAEKNIGYFALYVLYFPQLVAGPIERPQNILHQLKEKHKLDWQNILDGLRLIIWGLFKKAVIADRISYYVNDVFTNTAQHNVVQVWVGIVFFSIQIYADFSGYSDMAIGISKTMGIDLMVNFNRPYFAKNIQEFWQRWHISLSTWFRDYVYFSIGGNRFGIVNTIRNLSIVFVLSGIWHGAGFNFIAWGGIHAFFISIFVLYKKYFIEKTILFPSFLSIIFTYSIVVFAWIFFRAENFHQAVGVIKAMCQIGTISGHSPIGNFGLLPFGTINFSFSLIMILCMLVFECNTDTLLKKMNNTNWFDIFWIVIIINIILFKGVFTKQNFIYFQF